ncbi:MAG: Hpt domain-containing protein, partial [Steroidobacteraceae bacterium]
MSIDLDQFHEVFFVESFEALDSMESALLRLTPGAVDSETINTIFRVAHSIKGGAGMFGFAEITSFTHVLETLLDELRAGRMEVTAPICEGLLQSVDQIRAMITATQTQQPLDLSVSNVLQEQFKQIVAAGGKSAPTPGKPAAVRTAAGGAGKGASAPPLVMAGGGMPQWRIGFKALPELLNRGNDPLRIFDELSGLGELTAMADCSQVPSLPDLDPAQCHIQWELLLSTNAPREAIDLIFEWADGDCELSVTQV